MAAKPIAPSAAVIARSQIGCQSWLGIVRAFWQGGELGHASLCYELCSLIVGTIDPRLSSRAMRFGSTTNLSDEDVLRLTIRTSQNRSQRVFDMFRLPQGASHDRHYR